MSGVLLLEFVENNYITMKRILLVITLFLCMSLCAQEKYTILLTGASFASPENGWFEVGCKKLNARPINRAIGGEAIADTANRMSRGELYSSEELDNIDAFVIMQVHNQDVFEDSMIRENYTDYILPFDRSNYAAAYDYVIKKYITDCYNLKSDPKSKYYNTPAGKPASIILCTHWHDGRPVYNNSVRDLADEWGFPLVEFDKYIGFSSNQLHPVTKKQVSVLFTDNNTEEIDGETFGWHQYRGQDTYIQARMAAIFSDLMQKILPIK